jgi:hypothetical protein
MINVNINFINHGDTPIKIFYNFEIKEVNSPTPVANLPNSTHTLQPNESLPYSINRVYSAGNYRLSASAYINNTTTEKEDTKDMYFWVANPSELYANQSVQQNQELARFTLYSVFVAIAIAMITAIGTYLQFRSNKQTRKDSNKFAEEQLRLMKASNWELKESNELTRLSMVMDNEQIKAKISEPIVTVVNLHPEPPGQNGSLQLFPNFRNDGESALRNIKIYYKVFDRFVDIKEIVCEEQEIKKSVMDVPESIIPHASKNLNDGRQGIPFPNTDGPKSVTVWFSYKYFELYESEVVFDLRYNGKKPVSKSPARYDKIAINNMRVEKGLT